MVFGYDTSASRQQYSNQRRAHFGLPLERRLDVVSTSTEMTFVEVEKSFTFPGRSNKPWKCVLIYFFSSYRRRSVFQPMSRMLIMIQRGMKESSAIAKAMTYSRLSPARSPEGSFMGASGLRVLLLSESLQLLCFNKFISLLPGHPSKKRSCLALRINRYIFMVPKFYSVLQVCL